MNGDSPLQDHVLVPGTLGQVIESWKRHKPVWGKTLSVEEYLIRESILAEQPLTRNGGCTTFVLVPRHDLETLDFACSCDVTRRTAIVYQEGQSRQVVSYGIGSVYTPSEKRGKGYALRMMSLLHDELAKRGDQKRHHDADFSILYSDIGGNFYSRAGIGWHVISPFEAIMAVPKEPLTNEDAGEMRALNREETLALLGQAHPSQSLEPKLAPGQIAIRIEARPALFDLQFRRSIFYAALANQSLTTFGFKDAQDNMVVFTPSLKDNILQILQIRLSRPDNVAAEARLIRRSIKYAQEMNSHGFHIESVVAWNVNPETLKCLDVEASEMKDSWPAIAWYGDASVSGKDIQWLCNEKYAWC